jgi:hypothetical protein
MGLRQLLAFPPIIAAHVGLPMRSKQGVYNRTRLVGCPWKLWRSLWACSACTLPSYLQGRKENDPLLTQPHWGCAGATLEHALARHQLRVGLTGSATFLSKTRLFSTRVWVDRWVLTQGKTAGPMG